MSVTVLLPYETAVVVQSFVNASNAQRVTIQPTGQPAIVFSGKGFYDTPIGQTTINTPAGDGSGYPVAVTVEYSPDGGRTWSASAIDWVDCQVMYYALAIVISEDANDNTWNDATTYFTWTEPPAPVLIADARTADEAVTAPATRA